MKQSSNLSLSWDQVFDQATEDVSICLWAAELWPSPPADYSPGQLFTLAMAHRARARAALDVIRGGAPDQLAPYIKDLESVLGRAEEVLASQADSQAALCQQVLDQELAPRARGLERALDRVLRLEEDSRLYENLETIREEHKEAAHEFVLRFQDMAHACAELAQPPFSQLESREVTQQVQAVESLFKKRLSAFTVIQDLLPAIREREYGLERWWLEPMPAVQAEAEAAISAQLMAAFGQTLAQDRQEFVLDDDTARDVIAHALGELDPASDKMVLERLAATAPAMDLAHDVRLCVELAENMARRPALLPELARAMRPLRTDARTWAAFWEKVNGSLSSLFSPKLVGAAAMAGLAFLIITAIPVDNAPDQAPAGSPGQALVQDNPAPRLLPKGALGLTARKDDRYITRVSALGPIGPDIFPMEQGWALESGDSVRINARMDRDGYAYVVHQDTDGKPAILFSGPLKAQEDLVLPQGDNWFMLDRYPGEETLHLLSAAEPVKDMESRVLELASGKDVRALFPGMDVQTFSFKHQ